MTKFKYIIIIILLFSSCEKKTNWQLQQSDNHYIIIEGIITNEYKFQQIKITKSANILNSYPQNIYGANVSVSDGENSYIFTQNIDSSGLYYSNEKFIGTVDRTYTLTVIYNDNTYSASAYMLPVNNFNIVSYTFVENKNQYKLSSTPSQFDAFENAMYKIDIDRSNIDEYRDSAYFVSHSILYFYTLTSLDVPEFFAPDAEQIYFPKGTIITETKYSLTPEQACFYRSLLLETTWRGGSFDLEQGNVTTNLTNGALGYFGASSIITKTITVQ